MTTAAPPAPAATDRATSYAKAAAAGELVVGKWIQLAAARHLRDLEEGSARGLYFDVDLAEWAIEFFPEMCRHSKGEWAGRPLRLQPWQMFIIGSLFGWLRRYGECSSCGSWAVADPETELIRCDNPECDPELATPASYGWLRRFRTSYVELPRKNGKSTLAAGVGLLLAFFDDEPGAEVYAAATKRDQAKIVWGEAKQMVTKSPQIRRRGIRVLMNNLSDPLSGSKFEPLGADADNMDGLNISGCVIDELHAHKTRAVWDVLETATGARRQPLSFAITTAGSDRKSVCYEQHEYGTRLLEGLYEDDTFFVFIAAIDEGDDPFDPINWRKANPNYGVSVKPDDLERKAEKAKAVETEKAAFLRLHLGVWTGARTSWIGLDLWLKGSAPIDPQTLLGRRCFGGLDLARSHDLSAFALLFPPVEEDELWKVLVHCYCPEDDIEQRSLNLGTPYATWRDQGWITATDGNTTDYDAIREDIVAAAGDFDLVEVAYDRTFAGELITGLQREGIELSPFGQGFISMASPVGELERLSLGLVLNHGGNPVLAWAVANVIIRQDPAGNKKPDKAASADKIDPLVALIMALGRAMVVQEEPESVYKERGFRSF